jgi:CelD/BcsL family acetyltransferase involved in cellulose biosynthesis
MLSARLIEHGDDLKTLAPMWDGLLQRSEFVSIFGTAGFAKSWWHAYGPSRALRVVVVEDGSSGVRLIAPFCVEPSTPGLWELIGNFRADYNNLIFEAGDIESLDFLFSWLQRNNRWRVLQFGNIPGDSAVLRYFGHASEPTSGYMQRARSWLDVRKALAYRSWHSQHPVIGREHLGRFTALMDRPSHRKHVNWFTRMGCLRYRCITDCSEIRLHLDEFMNIHIAQRAAKGQESLFLNTEDRVFYMRLTEDLEPYNALRMDLLTLDDRIVAAHVGFDWSDRIYYYKPCHDPVFNSHSPGKLLLAHILCGAFQLGTEEVDLLKGREPYKEKYASDIRTTGTLMIYRSRSDALLQKLKWSNPPGRI